MPEWCVSYAWNDTTPEGRDREATVDRLCDEAAARGMKILRDKTALGLGDSLSKFMRRIGQGNPVFIILSDRYLRLHVITNPAAVFVKAATCERSGSARQLGVSPTPPRGAEWASGV